MPDEASSSSGHVADDGTVVYPESDSRAATAVQADGDGVLVATVASSADQVKPFTYVIDGAIPVLQGDGSVLLVAPLNEPEAQELTVAVGRADTPWATDADGESVATHYEVNGSELTQVVDVTSDTAYPVVADPRFSVGTTVYVSLNQIEIKGVAVAAAGVALGAGTVTCEVYAKRFTAVPGVGTFVKYACNYVALTKVAGLMKSVAAHTAAYYTHTCYQYGFGAGQTSWKVVGTSQCVSPSQSWQIG